MAVQLCLDSGQEDAPGGQRLAGASRWYPQRSSQSIPTRTATTARPCSSRRKPGTCCSQGWTVTHPATLAEVDGHSRIADDESVVRLPARMRAIILEALSGHGTAVRRADSGDDQLGGAPGDAGRVHAV